MVRGIRAEEFLSSEFEFTACGRQQLSWSAQWECLSAQLQLSGNARGDTSWHVEGVQDYTKLVAWQKGHALLLHVHDAIRKFPARYDSLHSQIFRAAQSIPSNIVEGSAMETPKEFARFLGYSISSSSELQYRLLIAKDCQLITTGLWTALTEETIEVRRITIGLRKKVRAS